jgi:hypothetical protein
MDRRCEEASCVASRLDMTTRALARRISDESQPMYTNTTVCAADAIEPPTPRCQPAKFTTFGGRPDVPSASGRPNLGEIVLSMDAVMALIREPRSASTSRTAPVCRARAESQR